MQIFEAFEASATAWLASHAHIPHEWEREDRWRFLEVPAYEPNGFTVRANCSSEFVYVLVDRGGLFVPFDVGESEPVEETAERAFAMLRLCLSDAARLRQELAGGKPYRWTLEIFRNAAWTVARTDRLIVHNWFAAKSERVLQNQWIKTGALQHQGANGS